MSARAKFGMKWALMQHKHKTFQVSAINAWPDVGRAAMKDEIRQMLLMPMRKQARKRISHGAAAERYRDKMRALQGRGPSIAGKESGV